VEAAPTSSEYRVHAYARVDDPEDTILFPREIGLEVCGRNNGAGVGSEPAEAVVTGLLEIFERYAVEKFALGTERFPLIDPKVLANARAGRIADFLTSQGCETHFVDMSLGGHLPVVGVLLIRPRSDAMSIAVAGSHNLEEAVEHGLREALSDDFYRDRLIGWPETRKEDDRARAWSRSGFTLGWGGSLDFIDFARGYSRAYEAAFDATVADNQALLRRCLTIARGFGSEVYARDCSVLGVPAFHVYASVLSDNMFVAHEGLMSEARNAALLNAISRDRWLRDYLPVLDQCHSGTFDNWRTLYALLDNPFVGFPDDEDVCDYFGWPVTTPEGSSPLASDRRGVALSTLVAGLAYHAGEYATALALWRQPKSLRGPDHEIVAHYLELTAKLGTLPAAKEVFGAALGASRLADVERALSVESLVRLPTGEGDPAVVETTKRWSHLRKMIYPGAGQWRAKPFELGLG
jgi:hypothetical protein